ncbi:metal-dependent hydrolase family protein [Gordonia paraffinivorans]|uniref:metal-dependent hydrolase family protein n=1 Tax=Gordonia paraffinivorans TaxID=175628 RepID=UPI001E394124|nr:amidohydrolase family protein [Gordonia paraffinivorans]MCD2147392.1 amidohydrolase family protein [Gordonia paraffinivorans]
MSEIAIEHGLVWVSPDETYSDGLLYIENSRVSYAGEYQADVVRPGVSRLDASGCVVLPGLVDCHVHLTTNSDPERVVTSDEFRGQRTGPEKLLHGYRNGLRALRSGFTTLRCMGHRDVGEIELRDMVDAGLIVAPNLLVAPWWITMTNGHGDLFYPPYTPRREGDTADGVDACRKMVRLQARSGADFIKVMASGGMSKGEKPHWPNYSVEELAAIVEEAHDMDLRVAAHALSLEGIRRSIEAGVDSIEHGSFLDEECASEMAREGIFLVPTLAFNDWCQREGTARGLTEAGVESLREAHDRALESFDIARSAGVKIAMGTDSSGTLCPFGAHYRELELYVEQGMSVNEALASATAVASELLGRPDIGSLRPGSMGDALIVDRTILSDISRLREGIKTIIRSGRDVTDYLGQSADVLAL